MSTLTVRLPDDKHERLKELAKRRNMSVNKLMEELSTIAITEYDTEARFRIAASRGPRKQGLDVLNKLEGKKVGKR